MNSNEYPHNNHKQINSDIYSELTDTDPNQIISH
jgi:hypothetical protein